MYRVCSKMKLRDEESVINEGISKLINFVESHEVRYLCVKCWKQNIVPLY